ncbi:unnamed protein product [Vicia faba]|uniref:PHD-type domain-containing protein n=1 Tax=Vicia faba TaxID=3906 RepID=A0AAV0YQE2_VICFA|nr:unnamed protein product [Vicia faba]
MDDVSVDPPPEVENGGGEPSEEPCSKKARVDAVDKPEAELKRVAEIVLVLSTMATMRGGQKPTDVEVELMREARSKLAILCQGIAPKDIVAREAIGAVIEDLGLNAKVGDQRLGFRAPKMSIAEKYAFNKSKMEESRKLLSASSTTYASQPLQTNTDGMVDNHVPTNTVRMFSSDKSNHMAVTSSVSMVSIPPHLSAGSSAALQYQSTSNEVRPPIVSGVMPSSHMGRNPSSVALPRVENPQFKVTGGLSGAPYVLQVQANSLANQSLVNAPTWSIQTHPVSLARSVSENKAPAHNPPKVEGTADATVLRAGPQVATGQSIRPFITQTGPGNMSSMHQPLQGGNMVQPPLIPSHSDIAKIVQKLLLPKFPEHRTWTPPSRDYMNKAFTCQTCELTVSEVDSVLLCDACEKGFHLKCLQPSVIRGIHNRVDWHCTRCLSLSGGKSLPPKYGRVTRSSITSPSFPSNTVGIQPSSEKKADSLDLKIQEIYKGESCAEQIDSKALICKDTAESETPPKSSEPAKCENLQSSQDSQVEMAVSKDTAEISPDRHDSSSFMTSSQKESHGGENITNNIKRDDLDVEPISVGSSGTNTEDEKKYYQSCCIDGVTYRVHGHAFFTSNHGKLTPSKLQSMWEDSKTGMKWVKATKCYFPDDLPGNIGHPCISEVNEFQLGSELTLVGPDKTVVSQTRNPTTKVGTSAALVPNHMMIYSFRYFSCVSNP